MTPREQFEKETGFELVFNPKRGYKYLFTNKEGKKRETTPQAYYKNKSEWLEKKVEEEQHTKAIYKEAWSQLFKFFQSKGINPKHFEK